MYESPIEVFYKDLQMRFKEDLQNNCIKAVQNYGIQVNKEELLKALAYDRHQYEKGFREGASNGKTKLVKVIKTEPDGSVYSFDAYLDEPRGLIFTQPVMTIELAEQWGYSITEREEQLGGAL